ncbi:MAG: sigma-70 family RNA polymerase sigma factor [Bacteroidetes bacterium]|nr:sigma-70 family RNA polymerase sigma factor [Bacteroidota bacterium]
MEGNRQAQSALYEMFSPKMFVVCMRYARSREEAEEVLQEGFLKVFQFLHQFKNAGSFEGWIRKIMVNCALQRLRSKSQLAPVLQIEAYDNNFKVDEHTESRISAKELLELVMLLPPAYKMVFNLYVFEGYKHKEIAEMLGISEGTSKSNLSDARAFLQKYITRKTAIAK